MASHSAVLIAPPVPDAAPPAPAVSNETLLDGVRAGDARALQALLDEFWPSLLAFAARILGDGDAAEDVVQRGFIRFWERRERWVPGSSPQRILFTVVHNLALNQLESDRARSRRNADRRLAGHPTATPSQILDETELGRVLDRAVQALPLRRREALVLARYHHKSHEEIAAVMGLAPRTVTNHITLALAELEAVVGRYLDD